MAAVATWLRARRIAPIGCAWVFRGPLHPDSVATDTATWGSMVSTADVSPRF
jgi:hypothetical protein